MKLKGVNKFRDDNMVKKTDLRTDVKKGTYLPVEILVGQEILTELRNHNPKEYDEMMSNPINGCECGFIKKGDEKMCPKCEETQLEEIE